MPERTSPTVRRRRLSNILSMLVEADDRTVAQLAKDLGWSSAKLHRMLADDWEKPQPAQVEQLLLTLGITDQEQRANILSLVAEGRERGWWYRWKDALSEGYYTYIGLEAEATVIRDYESHVLPGLLQTEDYARAVFAGAAPTMDPDLIEQLVQVRLRRQQELLHSTNPPKLWAVVDESVLRRNVGGPDVMTAQLLHLLQMAHLPNVTFQVIPEAAGAHPGLSPFVVMTFADPLDPEVVYAESVVGEHWVNDPRKVADFFRIFVDLIGRSLTVSETLDMIKKLVTERNM